MTSPTPIACIDVVELVTDYFEDALPVSSRVGLDAHLGCCADCSTYFAQLRATVRLTHSFGAEDVPDALGHRLLAVFRAWHIEASARHAGVDPP